MGCDCRFVTCTAPEVVASLPTLCANIGKPGGAATLSALAAVDTRQRPRNSVMAAAPSAGIVVEGPLQWSSERVTNFF
jgi:hypothetical protein